VLMCARSKFRCWAFERVGTCASSSGSPSHDFLAFSKFFTACVNSFFLSKITPSSKVSCSAQPVIGLPSLLRLLQLCRNLGLCGVAYPTPRSSLPLRRFFLLRGGPKRREGRGGGYTPRWRRCRFECGLLKTWLHLPDLAGSAPEKQPMCEESSSTSNTSNTSINPHSDHL